MKKKKPEPPNTFPSDQSDDWFMGMAVWYGGNTQGAVIADSNPYGAYGKKEQISCGKTGPVFHSEDHIIPADYSAILKAGKIPNWSPTRSIYLTYTPTYASLLLMLDANIKTCFYMDTGPLDEKSKSLLETGHLILKVFEGNVNWLRDYVNWIFESAEYARQKSVET